MADLRALLDSGLAGHYTLERELGRGGMATVFLAHDLKHERLVALKVLRPELAATLGPDRFRREIHLAARLQHPHILSVHDSGEAAGQLWFTMPYVEGESLRTRLTREGQLQIEAALRITREAAEALQYAHEHGVIHRDIKPENLLLTPDGNTFVADFGIARALGDADGGEERLTETGLSLGTPRYMSPEQASAERALDARTDVYSLGCVLYEMLAGEAPYTGPTAQSIMAKRFSEPVPSVRRVRPSVSEAVDLALQQALALVPADRFPSAGEFAAALGRTAPAHRAVSRRTAALLGGVAALTVVALLAFFARPARTPQAMVTRQLTFTGKVTEPALSPDGQSLVYVAGFRLLVVQRLDGGEPQVLVPPARFILYPRWTADGRAIVFIMFRDSTELAASYIVPSAGGLARKVLEDIVPLATGPDSTMVVRIPREKHRLEVINLQTGAVVRGIPIPDSLGDAGNIAWSGDRRFLAFEARGAVWTVPASGGSLSRVTSGRSPRWSDRSGALYYLDGPPNAEALYKVPVDHRSGEKRGVALRLAALPGVGSFDLHRGRLVYTLGSTSSQARVLAFGGSPRRLIEDRLLTEGTAPVSAVTISPDGRWVAYSQARGEDEKVYVVPFGGGSPRPVVASPARETQPTWSPAGSRLAFVREDSGGRALMLVDVAGGTAQRASSLPGPGAYGGDAGRGLWSADGQHLSYISQDLRSVALVNLDRQTEADIRIPDSVGTGYLNATPSPDGREVLVSTVVRATDWGELWVAAAAGGPWRKVRGPFGESYPLRWHTDGWIYVLNSRAQSTDYGPTHHEVWRMRGPDGVPELFAPLPDGCTSSVDLSADGSRITCVSYRRESDLYVATGFDADSH